jgi:hypothetical protein
VRPHYVITTDTFATFGHPFAVVIVSNYRVGFVAVFTLGHGSLLLVEVFDGLQGGLESPKRLVVLDLLLRGPNVSSSLAILAYLQVRLNCKLKMALGFAQVIFDVIHHDVTATGTPETVTGPVSIFA